jgi:hypothetical protein
MDQPQTPPPLVKPLDHGGAPAPPAAAARPARAPKAQRSRLRVPLRALIAAAVVLAAAVLVWAIFIRDTGNPFAGTWKAPAGAPIAGTVVISGPGRHIEASFSGADPSGTVQSFTVRAHEDGADLVITAEDFADAAGDVADAQRVRDTFAAYVKDFRLVFAPQDVTHLELTVEGTFVGLVKVSLAQRSILLTKVD